MLVELRFNGIFIGQVYVSDIHTAMTYKTSNGNYVLKLNDITFIITEVTVKRTTYGQVYTVHIKH